MEGFHCVLFTPDTLNGHVGGLCAAFLPLWHTARRPELRPRPTDLAAAVGTTSSKNEANLLMSLRNFSLGCAQSLLITCEFLGFFCGILTLLKLTTL